MWNAFGWIISTAIIVLVIFGHYPFTQSDIHTEPIHFVSFLGVSRVMWAVAVSYIIFACHHGYGGPLNMLLSLSLWQPLSRLTYAIYISHNFVIFMIMATVRFPLYFSNISMVGKHFTKIHSLTKHAIFNILIIFNSSSMPLYATTVWVLWLHWYSFCFSRAPFTRWNRIFCGFFFAWNAQIKIKPSNEC